MESLKIHSFNQRCQVITIRNAIIGEDSTKRVPITWRCVSDAEENN